MKKGISLVLALTMLFALCACGKSSGKAAYSMLSEAVSTEQYAVGFALGNDELKDAVQAALYVLLADGTVDKVAEKYADYSLASTLCLNGADATTFDMSAASAELQSRTTFNVGFDAEYPPFGYMDADGSYTGFDLELAEAVCALYGWELIKTPIDWDTKDVTLSSGQIDCIWNGFTVTGRESEYCWTVPYVDNSIVVLTNNAKITSLADLAGKNVVTQAGSSALAALEGDRAELCASFKALTQVADFNTAMMNLDSGIVDAVVIDIGVAQYYLSNQG